jgi:FMN-dependent NADH-azoreductase
VPRTILHIDSSPLGERSVSRKLTAKVLAELRAKDAHSKIITRDIGTHPLPHLSGEVIGAFFTPPDQRDAAVSNAIRLSDEAVDELLSADIIVIGAPMYNFAVPTQLKAWIDRSLVAGRTFHYTATGPEGLLPKGKKVIVASSRGGFYGPDSPIAAFDHQETYLTQALGFIGLTDLTIVRAEGIAVSPDSKEAALASARQSISALAA